MICRPWLPSWFRIRIASFILLTFQILSCMVAKLVQYPNRKFDIVDFSDFVVHGCQAGSVSQSQAWYCWLFRYCRPWLPSWFSIPISSLSGPRSPTCQCGGQNKISRSVIMTHNQGFMIYVPTYVHTYMYRCIGIRKLGTLDCLKKIYLIKRKFYKIVWRNSPYFSMEL